MSQIEQTLRELDRWYNELPGGTDRPKLLSKLATLELCGWIEHRLDTLVLNAGATIGLDQSWIEKNVVKDNHGFTYQDHLRRMLAKMAGEFAVQHVEQTLETAHPGTLERLKGSLTTLWTSRGPLAHTHSGSPMIQQQTLNAPSWAINQQRIVGKMIDELEAILPKAFTRTIAKV